MVQQASTSSVQEAIRLHLEPDIIWSTLPALLDLIAHVALLARKVRNEIERLRDEVEFGMEHQLSLIGICTMTKTAEEAIWRQSLEIRELVSLYVFQLRTSHSPCSRA